MTTNKKPFRDRRVRDAEKVRLEGLVSDLKSVRDHLEHEVRQKSEELKVVNGQLKNGMRKQQRSEEQVHIRTKAMEATADGIFIIDAQKSDFPVIYANPSFKRMNGRKGEEVLGRDYFLVYGADADPRVIEEIKQTIRKGKAFHAEMINFQKNGKKYLNLLRIAPVRDASGCVTHYVGIQTDVTLMRDKQMEIIEQRKELLHVTRVGKLAEFVSSLAHEISQPLTAILSYAQAAQRMLLDREPGLQKILSHIIDDDKRATEVIHRLRSLLKKSAPEMKPLGINAFINETVALIATDATVRNVFLTFDLESDLFPVFGDKIQLQQVLLNLISNSFDAMENSPGPREILIRTSRKNSDVIAVAVKDSGCGIAAKNIPKIFTHFFTSKSDGLGMGLSISRSIVEAHGGRLEAENNPDRGATFTFTLPVDRKDVP